MKIFITSNTLFGYTGISDHQFSYFNESLIPMIKKTYNSGDIFVHLGGVFSNRSNMSFKVVDNTLDIFENISSIMPIYIIKSFNDSLSLNIIKRIGNIEIIENHKSIKNITMSSIYEDFKYISNEIFLFNHDYLMADIEFKNLSICGYHKYTKYDKDIINIGSPYQLNKSDVNNKKGFIIVDSESKKNKFIENTFSPKFVDIKINEISDIGLLNDHKNDFLDIHINRNILSIKENKNKIDIEISKYNIKNITYYDDKTINDNTDYVIDENFTNIRKLINDKIKYDLSDLENELDIVFNVYDKRN